MVIDWGNIIYLLIGAAIGFFGNLILERQKRKWQEKDENRKISSILQSLEEEIKIGIDRAEALVGFAQNNKVSFSRVYTGIWDSTRVYLVEKVEGVEILRSLQKIYTKFDLINFNMEAGSIDRTRLASGAAFAKEYIAEIRENYEKFKKIIKI